MSFFDALLRRAPGVLAQGLHGQRQGQQLRAAQERQAALDQRKQEQDALEMMLLQEDAGRKRSAESREAGLAPARQRLLNAQASDEEAAAAGTGRYAPTLVRPPTERNIDPLSAEGIEARKRLAAYEQGLKPPAAGTPGGRPRAPTDSQVKTGALFTAGKQAYDTLEGLLAAGKEVPSWTGQQLSKLGMGTGNVLTNQEYRQLRQAALILSDSWLRFTSGAAVPETEVERFAQSFIPQAGDDPVTLGQKAASRKTILGAMQKAAGTTVQDPLVPDAVASPGDDSDSWAADYLARKRGKKP